MLVGWDTLDGAHLPARAFPAYQSGREFDDALLEQLDVLPEFVAACGFANAKGAGYEADDFLAAAVAAEERRGGTALVASGDRDTFQLASERRRSFIPVRAGEMARIGPAEVRERYGVEPEAGAGFHRACAAIRPTSCRARRGVGPKGAADLLRKYGTLEGARGRPLCRAGGGAAALRSIATMDAKAPLPPLGTKADLGEGVGAGARVGAEPAGGAAQ